MKPRPNCYCGKPVKAHPQRPNRWQKTCSRECFINRVKNNRNINRTASTPAKLCVVCGDSFEYDPTYHSTPSNYRRRLTCGDECEYRLRRQQNADKAKKGLRTRLWKAAELWLTEPDCGPRPCGNPRCTEIMWPRSNEHPSQFRDRTFHNYDCGEAFKSEWASDPANAPELLARQLGNVNRPYRRTEETRRKTSKAKVGKTTLWNLSQKVEWRYIKCSIDGCARPRQQKMRTKDRPRNQYNATCGETECVSALKWAKRRAKYGDTGRG